MLTVLALGHLTFEQIQPLQPLFGAIEVVDLGLRRDAVLADHGAELNRAIAAAANPWILILREREQVSGELAAEMRQMSAEPAQAFGFRIATRVLYEGRPLLFGKGAGEVRLFHQRHARFDARRESREIKIEGTIIRLQNPLEIRTFATAAEHVAFLRSHGVPHSLLRRLLIFARNAVLTGAWFRSRATLRYLWLEAGFDLGGGKREEGGERNS